MSEQNDGRRPRDRLSTDDETETTATTPTATDEAVNAEDYIPEPGHEVTDEVPVENWVYWPPIDHTEYLDGPEYGVILPDGTTKKLGVGGEGEAEGETGGEEA